MQNMDFYYDFSGQKFDYPLSLSINGFSRNIFSRQSSLEISYVLKGEYEAVTKEFSYVLKEREMIVIAPDDIHMLHKKNDDNSIILTIHIDFSRMTDAMVGNVHDAFSTAVCTNELNSKTYIELRNKIGELISELVDKKNNLYYMNAIMMEIVRIVASKSAFSIDDLPLHTEYHENYMKAIRYIDGHYNENLTLGEIASQLSFSVSYTSKLIKKYTGIPFVKYLAYVRVRASLEKLLEGRESIEKIAADFGLPSSKAYTMVFKELYGIVPSAYRKQFQNNKKFSDEHIDKKMELDDDQKKLLQHLINDSKENVYEDEHVTINKVNNKMVITVKNLEVKLTTDKDGTMTINMDL